MEQEKGYSYQVYQGLQSIPECTIDDLREADAVLFGSPTRCGNMTAQMKALIDSTAQLWAHRRHGGHRTINWRRYFNRVWTRCDWAGSMTRITFLPFEIRMRYGW
jgi:hypothetical protein